MSIVGNDSQQPGEHSVEPAVPELQLEPMQVDVPSYSDSSGSGLETVELTFGAATDAQMHTDGLEQHPANETAAVACNDIEEPARKRSAPQHEDLPAKRRRIERDEQRIAQDKARLEQEEQRVAAQKCELELQESAQKLEQCTESREQVRRQAAQMFHRAVQAEQQARDELEAKQQRQQQ